MPKAVTCTITGITQDEPVSDTSAGSGSTCPDAVVVNLNDGNQGAGLRCERDGTGNGRVYTVSFTASDGNGGECSGSVNFCVPHERKSVTCVDDGQNYDSTSCPGGAGIRVLTIEEFYSLTPQPLFIRGDVNWDDQIDASDGTAILQWSFQSAGPLDCPDAADMNDDGDINISDAIGIFSHLRGDLVPPASFAPGAGRRWKRRWQR